MNYYPTFINSIAVSANYDLITKMYNIINNL